MARSDGDFSWIRKNARGLMRILLTGASSFTGFWIAKVLVHAGHEVVATLSRGADEYVDGPRAERVRRLKDVALIVPNCPFGSEVFMQLLSCEFDLLAHHAAQVGDYRNPDFDIIGAVSANTYNLKSILGSEKIRAVLLTSSVFAPNEGIGSEPMGAFSAYGLSKGLTTDLVTYLAEQAGIPVSRFVIPNPFGPLEEPRFCSYLMRNWRAGTIARVNTPAYIRDNIHVDLLAKAYCHYAEQLMAGKARRACNPSGYVGTQGDFALRLAGEMQQRLGWRCGLEFVEQMEFSEPIMRVNTDPANLIVRDWSESNAWDSMAEAYR